MENIRAQIQKEKYTGINAARVALITGITTLVGAGTFLYGLGVISTVATALQPFFPVFALLPAVAPAAAPALCLIGAIVGGLFGTVCLIAVVIGIVKAISQGTLRDDSPSTFKPENIWEKITLACASKGLVDEQVFEGLAQEAMNLLRIEWKSLLETHAMDWAVNRLEGEMSDWPLSYETRDQLDQLFRKAREEIL